MVRNTDENRESTFFSPDDDDPEWLRSAAEELHRRYHRLIYYFLRIFELPDDQIDDLFNQIFVKIIRGLEHIKHTNNLKSWVVTITKNEIYSYLHYRERELTMYNSFDDTTTTREIAQAVASPMESPERLLHERRVMDVFEESLGKLEPEIAEPFIMRYRDNKRWRDIGQALGINEDTARKRCDRARLYIMKQIKRRLGMMP